MVKVNGAKYRKYKRAWMNKTDYRDLYVTLTDQQLVV